jgi:hypothetical protein
MLTVNILASNNRTLLRLRDIVATVLHLAGPLGVLPDLFGVTLGDIPSNTRQF